MNMNELGIDLEQRVFDWSGGVDPLPEYDVGITESELAFMRELDPNFGYGGEADVIDLDARGFKSEYELIVMRILFPKPVKKIPTPNCPSSYTYKATAADALWLPEEVKSGIKDKVQALIRRCHDEVGKSFAALRQYVAQHASDFADTKDDGKGKRPRKDPGDSTDADPSLAPASTPLSDTKDEGNGKRPRKDLADSTDADPSLAPASTPLSGTKAEVTEGVALMREVLGVE